jgi:dTDP-4-amino-4,6-dideoxygalactose transaminase
MNFQSPKTELEELYVARPSMPPFDEFVERLRSVWSNRILTNRGPLAIEFERELERHLGVEHVSVVANAAVGLMVALMHVGAREIITTPFSFVATGNAIRATGARPVFADIDPVTFALDPKDVERRITPQTGAILAVHCYGIPCDIEAFDRLEQKYGIPVIYDAAHAFDVRKDGQSVLRSGKMSVVSFHSTKVFHSAEGGAIISRDAETKSAVDRICNHGITNETTVDVIGLNGKMSEIHAALGLTQLGHVRDEIAARGAVARRYAEGLGSVDGITLVCDDQPGHNNYAYPILVERHFPLTRDQLQAHLRMRGIVARRYFYPLISDLAAFRAETAGADEDLHLAREAAERVLCLPMYGDLERDNQMRVIDAIREVAL